MNGCISVNVIYFTLIFVMELQIWKSYFYWELLKIATILLGFAIFFESFVNFHYLFG